MRKVLVLDKTGEDAYIIHSYISLAGLNTEVTTVVDLGRANDYLHSRKPDIIVVDETGLDLIKELRTQTLFDGTTIVVYSPNEADKITAQANGANIFVAKQKDTSAWSTVAGTLTDIYLSGADTIVSKVKALSIS